MCVSDPQLPVLRPLVHHSDLAYVTMILAIYDHDHVGSDDPLGVT